MQHGWLTKTIGGRTIEHIPCPNPGGAVNEGAPPTGVIHTIEGSLESGLGVFRVHYAPHFTLDGNRSFNSSRSARWPQHSKTIPAVSRPTRSRVRRSRSPATRASSRGSAMTPTSEALADLLATLVDAAEIPLERPFPDKMPAKPWATYEFTRRKAGKWGHEAGWYGHVEVPENAHWDPGAFEWSKILRRANALAGATRSSLSARPAQNTPPKPLPRWYWRWLSWFLGEGDFKRLGPRNSAHRPADAPEKIPAWAWVKASQFTAARKEPHSGR